MPYEFGFRPPPQPSWDDETTHKTTDQQFREIVNCNWTPDEELALMRWSSLMN